MNPSLVCPIAEVPRFAFSQDLLELAKLSAGTQYDLVSFYFSLSATADGSHRQEQLMIKHLVHNALCGISKTSGLAADLQSLLMTAEEIRKIPSQLRAVFACKSLNFRREFALPAHGSVSYLNVGRSFHLLPLVRAMDACLPYCVVLIERGQARGFVVSGTEIREVHGYFAARNLSLHTDNSRVGWSHHIAGSREEHNKAYFIEIVPELARFLSDHGSNLLVIGCREDLWGEMAPHLPNAEWDDLIIGRFDPPNIEVAPFDVLQASSSFFEKYLVRRYVKLWAEVDSTDRCAVALDEIVHMLDEGRVQKLVLGKPSEQMIFECRRCGHLQVTDSPCQYCRNQLMLAERAQEALIRRGLLTDAKIAVPPLAMSDAPESAAALLRF